MIMHIDYKKVEINSDELIELKAIEHDIKSRFVLFQFISNNIPINLSDCNVRVYGKNNLGKEIFNNLTLIDPLTGKAKLELTDAFLVRGTTIYQLKIYNSQGARLSSNIFSLEVGQDLMDDNSIESTNEFTALEEALKTVDNIDINFRDVNSKIEHQGTNIKTNKNNIDKLSRDKLNKPTIVKGQAGFDWKIVKFEDVKYVTAWKYIDITGTGWHKLELPLKLETEFGYSVTLSGSDGVVIPFLTEPSFEQNSISVYISDNSNKYWRFRVMVNGFYIES
ncbi:DUF2479 domain-containing protein [Clostridium perfringens]|nr:DUF2479 domain-containing protein [Clostridium perfringens]